VPEITQKNPEDETDLRYKPRDIAQKMKENPSPDPDESLPVGSNRNRTETTVEAENSLEPKVVLKQRAKGKSENFGMERTVLTNWSKKAKKSQKEKPKEPEISANGAVRPKEAWNRNAPPKILITPAPELIPETTMPEYDGDEGFNMLKIGLGVFGGIALVLGCMLSFLYIQKKNKDQKLKNARKGGRRHRGHHQAQGQAHLPGDVYHDPYQQQQYPTGMYDPQGPFPPFQMPPGQFNQSAAPGQFGQMGNNPMNSAGGQMANIPIQYENEYTGQVETHYITEQQYFEQQAMEQNYYSMCQEYILQQRQMQAQAAYEQQPQYNTVLQYVEQIGENLKTPKARKLRKDGNATPHPIITRRGSMKSLAASEASGWNTEAVQSDKEDEVKSLAQSVCGSNLDEPVDDCDKSEKARSDSAYGSRGSIQSPHSGPKVNSAHMFSDEDHITDQSEAEDVDSPKITDSSKKVKMTSFEDEVKPIGN